MQADPRIVHLAVHPSAWSSSPPEVLQPAPQAQSPYQTTPSTASPYSPSYIYPTRSTYFPTQAAFATQISPLSLRPSVEYVRHQHQKALYALCPSIAAPVDHLNLSHQRLEAVQAVERNGWSWPPVLDEPFPDPSEGGVVYDSTIVEYVVYKSTEFNSY